MQSVLGTVLCEVRSIFGGPSILYPFVEQSPLHAVARSSARLTSLVGCLLFDVLAVVCCAVLTGHSKREG